MSAGIVLAGGASRRMGADKAFVVVDGRPMVVAVADALWEGGCSPVECQGGDVERLAGLGMTAFPDTRPGTGPVAAIVDALERTGDTVVVAACDLPGLDAATVRELASSDAAAAFARTGEGRPTSCRCGPTTPWPRCERSRPRDPSRTERRSMRYRPSALRFGPRWSATSTLPTTSIPELFRSAGEVRLGRRRSR